MIIEERKRVHGVGTRPSIVHPPALVPDTTLSDPNTVNAMACDMKSSKHKQPETLVAGQRSTSAAVACGLCHTLTHTRILIRHALLRLPPHRSTAPMLLCYNATLLACNTTTPDAIPGAAHANCDHITHTIATSTPNTHTLICQLTNKSLTDRPPPVGEVASYATAAKT